MRLLLHLPDGSGLRAPGAGEPPAASGRGSRCPGVSGGSVGKPGGAKRDSPGAGGSVLIGNAGGLGGSLHYLFFFELANLKGSLEMFLSHFRLSMMDEARFF